MLQRPSCKVALSTKMANLHTTIQKWQIWRTENHLRVGENSNLTQRRYRCVHFWSSDLQMLGGRCSPSIRKLPSASVTCEYVEFLGCREISYVFPTFHEIWATTHFLKNAKWFGTSMMSCCEIAMFASSLITKNIMHIMHPIRNAK